MSNRTVKKSSASSRRAKRPGASARATKRTRKPADELARLAALSDAEIDTSDIPEIVDWSGAVRGRFYRPVKQLVTIRLDADVVAWFKSRNPTYQTAVNRALRDYMLDHLTGRKRNRRAGLGRTPG